MTHKQKRIFFNWLQKHNALKAYKEARYKERNSPRWKTYEQLPIDEPFSWAFSWPASFQGSLYWENMCMKWFIYYHHNTGLFV
jgi:hypothetical protein